MLGRRCAAGALAAACVASGLLVSSAPTSAATNLKHTPPGRVLVISANLREAYRGPDDILGRHYDDVEETKEISTFALRLKQRQSYKPDVLLLQEVVSPTARRVARAMTARFGDPYRAKVRPRKMFPRGVDANPLVERETAIVYNRATMEAVNRGGYFRIRQKDEDLKPSWRKRFRDNAHLLLREKGTRMTVATMSVHFLVLDAFVSFEQHVIRRAAWARRINRFMDRTYRKADVRVMGGDFNSRRCQTLPETLICDELGFWDAMTDRPRLDDSVFVRNSMSDSDIQQQAGTRKRIDYIFARPTTFAASHDLAYDKEIGDTNFISDHRYVRAIVGKRL